MSEATENVGPVVNRKKAAALLGISEVTLRRWAHAGTGPALVKLGKAKNAPVRYPVGWLEAWLQSQAK